MVAGVLMGTAMAACSPEDFAGANESGKPTVDGVNVEATVDQATNIVTFTSSRIPGGYPLWYLPGNNASEVDFYGTQSSFTRLYATAGDKKIVFRTGNRNGFSDGTVEKTVHIDNSIKDLSAIVKALTDDDVKQWRIAKDEANHFACGNGAGGTDLWAADVNNLPNLALYDDFITLKKGTVSGNFNVKGDMTYNPGADGKCQFGGYGENDVKAASAQDSHYTLTVKGDDLILKLDPNTYFPFVCSENFLKSPEFLVESYSSGLLNLVAHDGNKYWHLVLTSADFGGGEPGWGGFTAGTNLLQGKTPAFSYYFADNNWGQLPDPVPTGDADKGFTFKMPAVGSTQWQVQIHMDYQDVTLSADKKYDFSVVIESDADAVINATVKPRKSGADDTFFSDGQHAIKKGTNVVALSDCAGWDGAFTLTLDLAGAPEGSSITVKNVFLCEHNAANVTPFDYNDARNVWRTQVDEVENGYTMEYYWAPGWVQTGNPGFEVKQKKTGANIFTITAPAATSDQWQAQNKFHTNISAAATDKVDFSCILIPSVDVKDVTVKLTDSGDDGNYFFVDRYDLKAGVANVIKYSNVQLSQGKDAAKLTLVLDCGGNPEGLVLQMTDVTIIKK